MDAGSSGESAVAEAPHRDPSVVWISLYNYLVTRNNGVGPGNMPKAFNELDAPPCPAPTYPVSPNNPLSHTHTCVGCVCLCVGKPDAERVRKSRKSLAEKTLLMAVPTGVG